MQETKMQKRLTPDPPLRFSFDVFRRSDGVIDLASIMVGVLVLGIIGGLIVATVFAVIPWSQDAAARDALESVGTAESIQFAYSTAGGDGHYLTMTGLTTEGNASGTVLLQSTDSVEILLNADKTRFVAVSRSDTGARFFLGSDHTKRVLDHTEGFAKIQELLGVNPYELGGIWAP